jgi:hypothetical protein
MHSRLRSMQAPASPVGQCRLDRQDGVHGTHWAPADGHPRRSGRIALNRPRRSLPDVPDGPAGPRLGARSFVQRRSIAWRELCAIARLPSDWNGDDGTMNGWVLGPQGLLFCAAVVVLLAVVP